MTITTFSSRELNHDVTRAKNAARNSPMFVTNRGKPTHVLLSIEEYQRLIGSRRNLAEALAMSGLADIEIETPRSRALPSPATFE